MNVHFQNELTVDKSDLELLGFGKINDEAFDFGSKNNLIEKARKFNELK